MTENTKKIFVVGDVSFREGLRLATWQDKFLIKKEKSSAERRAKCQKAEDDGIDVCWKCETIRPNRCGGTCGKCFECEVDEYGANLCYDCYWDYFSDDC